MECKGNDQVYGVKGKDCAMECKGSKEVAVYWSNKYRLSFVVYQL